MRNPFKPEPRDVPLTTSEQVQGVKTLADFALSGITQVIADLAAAEAEADALWAVAEQERAEAEQAQAAAEEAAAHAHLVRSKLSDLIGQA